MKRITIYDVAKEADVSLATVAGLSTTATSCERIPGSAYRKPSKN